MALGLVKLYQRSFSSYMGVRRCKYHPTCSCYMTQSIKNFGLLQGVTLGTWRILRCNPWSRGGYDPVPTRFPSFPFFFKFWAKRDKQLLDSKKERHEP